MHGKGVTGRFSTFLLLFILLAALPGLAAADPYVGGIPLTTVKSGIVSGGVYIDANNTWWPALPGVQNVEKTFASIPRVGSNIAWARLYVSVYCGHMQNNYQGTVAVSFDGNGDGTYETSFGTETMNVPYSFPNDGGSGPVTVNDHMNRVTSDYLMWYNVTSLITSQTPKAHVVTSALDGSFDGRIKVITLVVAYNDGDSDEVHFWVNQGHDTETYYDTTGYVGATYFDLSSLSGTVQSATLTVNHMASSDGTYAWYGDPLDSDPAAGNVQGAYFGYNTWDLSTATSFGDIYDLTYDRRDQFYKIPLAVLTVTRKIPSLPPAADFSATPLSDEAPATITFTDLSTNNPVTWKWEYRYKPPGGPYGGYLQFSSTRSPLYTFTGAGDYTIRLTAGNDAGTNSTMKQGYITLTPAAPPVAAFSATPASGIAPLAVNFTDRSTGRVSSWAWDFGNDGNVDSTEKNPRHTFTTPGTYDVNLTVNGPGGSDTEIQSGCVTVIAAPPFAEFTATPRSGYSPLSVHFTDLSTGTPTSWKWDFEDDGITDSTEQNPFHTYTVAGTFNVSLTATGPGGSDTELKNTYITVGTNTTMPGNEPGTQKPDADFSANPMVARVNHPVKFTDRSRGIVTTWVWDFESDGVTDSTAQDPEFSYVNKGTYSVTLTVRGPGGEDSETKVGYIKVRGDPTCDLTISGAINPVNLGSTVFAKEPNTIRVIGVRNNGPSESAATTIELASSDGTRARGQVPILAAGDNTTVTIIDPTIRSGAGGTVRYNVTVDPDDEVAETDETNNFKLSAEKVVAFNGYKGKRYWDGADLTTMWTFDLKGGLVHSFGNSMYRSGSFGGSGWTTYSVTWTPSDLQIPANATVKKALLYVPYTWDNTNAADSISISFNGDVKTRAGSYKDRSNFGAYANYDYGLFTYDITSSFRKDAENTAAFSRSQADAKLSMYGFTLAVVYDDAESSRKQIFLNEGFDLLGADETGYGTTPEEATAYVPFTGPATDPASCSRAQLISFVASGDNEGTLMFNGASVGGMWDFGSVSGPQVAVLTRDVKDRLKKTGNLAAIQSTRGETPAMAPIQQFLVIDYGAMDDEPTAVNLTSATLKADFSGGPLSGNATLSVTFKDLSAGSPTSWAWDFDNNGIVDNTTQHPQYSYLNPELYSVNLTVGNGTAFSTLVKTNYVSIGNTSGAPLQETILQDTVTGTPAPVITESATSHPEPLTILSVTDTTGGTPDGTPDQREPSNIAELLRQFLLGVASRIRESLSPLASRMPFLQEIQRAI